MNVKLEVKEIFNYTVRSIFALILVIIFFGVTIIFSDRYRYHDISIATDTIITIALTILFFYFMDDPLGTKYFLLSFEIRDDHVYISYKDKTILHEINGKRNDFKAAIIKGRIGQYATPSYLEIRFKGEVLVNQYFHRGWSKEKIDEIISYTL